MGEIWRKLVFLLSRGRFHRELDEEMRLHLEMKVTAAGGDPEASYSARRQFGNPTLLQETSREMWGWTSLEHLIQDIRFALRMIRRSLGLSTVAILSLALGIGANTAIFSLIDAVMLRMLPVQDPQHLSRVIKRTPGAGNQVFSYPAFTLFRDQSQTLGGLLAFTSPGRVHMAAGGAADDPERVGRSFVSGEFFSVLGVSAVLGRTFNADETKIPGSAPYAVLSYNFWKRRFALDPSVIGKRLIVDEIPVSVIGVTPPGFSGVEPGYESDVWLPATMMEKGCLENAGCQTFRMLARLKRGTDPRQAQAELDVLHNQHLKTRAAYIKNDLARQKFLNQPIALVDGSEGFSPVGEQFSTPLLVLMAMVGAVLLIACANVANLLLARATARQKEVAVRLALGAGRARLIRQFLTESAVLAAIGGALGLFVSFVGSQVLVALVSSPDLPMAFDLEPDLRVLAFTAAVSLGSGLLFGIAPAFRATRAELVPALKETQRSLAGSQGRFGLGKALVVSQVASSLLLLVGAGLFVRSLDNLRSLDTGFDRRNVLMFGLSMPRSYRLSQRDAAGQRLFKRVETLPGVLVAGVAAPAPLSGSTSTDALTVEGHAARSDEDVTANLIVVSQRFFDAMGTPLRMGRTFALQDTANSPRVALINETLARRFFGDRNPVGKHLSCSSCGGSAEIIGVVRDAKLVSLRNQTPATVFLSADQSPGAWDWFVIRTSGDTRSLLPALRQELKTIDANVALDRPRTLTDQMDEVLIPERMIAKLSGFFGLAALLLASLGLYGVMSYAVVRRTNEIGIRMALGAAAGDVLRQVLRESMVLVATGVVLGTGAALSFTHIVRSMLFGITPNDPITIALVTLLLLVVALIAGYLPARRAAGVDPMVALRYE